MKISEHISALPAALAPEMKTVASCSVQSLFNVAFNVAAIVTLGYFDKLNEIADNETGYDRVPQSLFLMAATIVSPTFRQNLSDGDDYRGEVGSDYSQKVDEYTDQEVKNRKDAFCMSLKLCWAVVHDLALGIFCSIRAASHLFSDAKLNKSAIKNLAALDGFHVAMNQFRDAVSITPPWVQRVDFSPLIE